MYCLAIRTVKPRCLAPRYLAKLAARHVNVKDGFLAMYFTSISRHPHLSPSPQLGWVSPGVIWPWYVATIGPAAAVQAHKASLLADQRIQPAVLVSVTVMTSLVPSSCTVSMLPPRPIAQRGSAILWLCSEQNVMAGKRKTPAEYAAIDSQLPTCDSLTDGQIINLVSTSSQASPTGSDEDEEEEEDDDGMLQDEHISPSVAVGAIDTLMRYFEQC